MRKDIEPPQARYNAQLTVVGDEEWVGHFHYNALHANSDAHARQTSSGEPSDDEHYHETFPVHATPEQIEALRQKYAGKLDIRVEPISPADQEEIRKREKTEHGVTDVDFGDTPTPSDPEN